MASLQGKGQKKKIECRIEREKKLEEKYGKGKEFKSERERKKERERPQRNRKRKLKKKGDKVKNMLKFSWPDPSKVHKFRRMPPPPPIKLRIPYTWTAGTRN